MNIRQIPFIVLFFLGFSSHSLAQKWVNPHFDAHRVDYRDLGYPAANMLEADNSPITALLSHSNTKIYGATSGDQSYLFVYDPRINKVLPLGRIPGARGVYHSLLEGADGTIYIGTGLNVLEQVPLTKEFPGGQRAIQIQLWKDINAPYEDYEGGHLFHYNPEIGDAEAYLLEDSCKVKDLGIPVPGNTIYCMTFNTDQTRIYGISYPDAHFFEYDLLSGESTDHGEMLESRVFSGPEREWRSVPRGLFCWTDGKIYTSGEDGLIVAFDPETEQFATTDMRIPGEYWEAWNYNGYPVAEQFVITPDSMIYGGTSDGFLFRLELDKQKIVNLGKPMVARRLRAMTVGHDQRLYMMCGEFQEPCELYAYDLTGADGFWNMGVLGVDRSPYYAKRPYEFDSMATGADGTIFIGESDRRAKLFMFMPGPRIFPATLNPTNPR